MRAGWPGAAAGPGVAFVPCLAPRRAVPRETVPGVW
jgi:hypothetical protein